MDAKSSPVKPAGLQNLSDHVRGATTPSAPRPSREAAEEAVRTLIAYAGDDATREGVLDTPKRVIDAYEEIYEGYRESPAEALDKTFSETGGYDDFVLVKDIQFNSHCEHHMMPFYGKAHVAYMPTDRVVGLSKLARLVDVYAHRLQTQEHMTSQIATAIEEVLKPRGVAVMRPSASNLGRSTRPSSISCECVDKECSWLSPSPLEVRSAGYFARSMVMKRTSWLGSSRNRPEKCVVTVSEPSLRTPRIDMHMCSASIITATPRGLRTSSIAVAICEVMCSCVCRRCA